MAVGCGQSALICPFFCALQNGTNQYSFLMRLRLSWILHRRWPVRNTSGFPKVRSVEWKPVVRLLGLILRINAKRLG
ncbi:hypothetical protein GGD68_008463 [Paraburkholderia fungorum]|jgi:hypothetical protein|uniref:Secreted protein n=1 Tax=Paraburkholderia fungorum TaxID=134537 RepID=A0AAW3V2G5_9BURK|nr:hypothetical protein [Paraburkholderia fungorum]MBB6203545.1 hypothetical protein [Paraburkholderia fungorum]